MKNKQPIKIQLASAGSPLSSLSLFPSPCLVCQAVHGTAELAELGCKGTYCIFLMMRTQVTLSAKTFALCNPPSPASFQGVYLNKHYADMHSSVLVHTNFLTFKFRRLGWHVFTLPSWAGLPGNTDDDRKGHEAQEMCHPRCCTSLWKVHGESGNWHVAATDTKWCLCRSAPQSRLCCDRSGLNAQTPGIADKKAIWTLAQHKSEL